MVSNGAKHSLINLLLALVGPGDEVIVPAPCWVSYPDMIKLAQGMPVIVRAGIESGFKMTPEQLEAAITPQTRLLILNSPSNPTGVCYSRADWEALGEVLRRHPRVAIASDDIYELIYWHDEPFCNIVMACPDLYERSALINGVSKAYAMTGWRIGYSAAGPRLTGAMKKIQGQMTSNASSISQAAAVAALDGDHQCVRDMVEVFKQRHDFVVERLNRGNGVRCLEAQGAFYAFPRCTRSDRRPRRHRQRRRARDPPDRARRGGPRARHRVQRPGVSAPVLRHRHGGPGGGDGPAGPGTVGNGRRRVAARPPPHRHRAVTGCRPPVCAGDPGRCVVEPAT